MKRKRLAKPLQGGQPNFKNWRKLMTERRGKHPPVRLQPIGKIKANGRVIVLGDLPRLDEEQPVATFYGANGHADVFEDSIELFVPALLAAAAPLLKKAVPAIMSAGKSVISTAAEALSGSEEGEEEAEESEEDSEVSEDRRKRRRRRLPPPEQIEQEMQLVQTRPYPGQAGMYYDEERGTIEFFFPALAGLIPAVGGLLGKLLGGKKDKKARRAKRAAARQAQLEEEEAAPPPPKRKAKPAPVEVEEEPGAGEPSKVQKELARQIAELKAMRSAEQMKPQVVETSEPIYNMAAAKRAFNILQTLRIQRITENATRASKGLEPLTVPDNPASAEDPFKEALRILTMLRMAAIQQNALNATRGAPPVPVPPDPFVTREVVTPPETAGADRTPPPAPQPVPEQSEGEDEDEDAEEDDDEPSDEEEFDSEVLDAFEDADSPEGVIGG